MQLAAALHPELERSGRRDALQKWRQMRQAIAMERRWSKDELLEAWLNLTAFRGELEGIDAAARALFGKRRRAWSAPKARCSRRSCARRTRRAARRAEGVRSAAEGRRRMAAARSLAAGGLVPRGSWQALDGDAPHLARKLLVRARRAVASTLDARVQRFAAATLEQHLRELEARNVEDGAILVLDNSSGEVLAWVGSAGARSSAAEVDGVTARRQPGSALKPFLYALALERRLLTAASILDDSSLAVTTPAGLYVPQNYDHTFRGKVSLRSALGASLNVPAVRTLALVGYEPFYEKLHSLGFDSLTRSADHYGYSLALGGAEVTLLALANAYRTLANGGRHSTITVSAASRPGSRCAGRRSARRVRDRRHPRRRSRPRFDVRSREPACDALSGERQDRHEHRDARQLGGRLLVALYRGRLGRQFLRRADARRLGRLRRGSGVARGSWISCMKEKRRSGPRRLRGSSASRSNMRAASSPRAMNGSSPGPKSRRSFRSTPRRAGRGLCRRRTERCSRSIPTFLPRASA
jgi:membrane carboxypeptidase/penicillin-binding protein PbpC